MYSIKASLSIVWVCSQPADSPGPSHATRQAPTNSQHASTAGGNNATPTKCKRPMNAFMLFAKKFRVEYTQMYPGKDNRWVGSVPAGVLWSCQCRCNFKCVRVCFRAISVLLGERWKKMRSEERRVFTVQAKALADEQKRLNPDCWKRKRTNSVRNYTQSLTHTHTHTDTHRA